MKTLTWPQWGAVLLALPALLLLGLGDQTLDERVDDATSTLNEVLTSRAKHVDPWELFEATHNNRMRVILLDTRPQSDFNLFHLAGAHHVDPATVRAMYPKKFTVVVVMGNDEARAEAAWRRLTVDGQSNAYVLSGGVNLWLDVFKVEGHGHYHVDAKAMTGAKADGHLRHRFEMALGAGYPFSAPEAIHGDGPTRTFRKKMKVAGAVAKAGGGCG